MKWVAVASCIIGACWMTAQHNSDATGWLIVAGVLIALFA